MLPVKLVTFDVTGTLLFFRTPILEKYLEMGLKFGIKANHKILKKNFEEAWKSLNKEHPNFGKKSGLEWQNWWACFVEKTFKGYIKPEEKNKILPLVEELIDFHTTKDAFTARAGTEELLQYLKTKSVQLGIISNYDPRLTQILELMELKKYFNFVLLSYEFGHSKPDVRIFQEALRLGSCALGDEAIHVGDDVELDYLGAKEAGFKALLISSKEKDLISSRVQRNEVFKDFFKLKTYFEGLDKSNL